MTLHRTIDGWQINAGCRIWEAPTVKKVANKVRRNIAAGPEEWRIQDAKTRQRWEQQVLAALHYLETMVEA
jgi:hypothetical protein